KILKIKWTWVATSVLATIVSALLAQHYVSNSKLAPLIPMSVAIAALAVMTLNDKKNTENGEWTIASWGFAKQIMPLLALGVLVAGFLLGSYHDDVALNGVIPNAWIEWAVGGNSLLSNFLASFVGTF